MRVLKKILLWLLLVAVLAALIVGGAALQQLWLFWLAPVLGGVLGALAYRVTVKE